MTLLKNKIFFNGEITKNWAIMMPDIWGDIQHNIMQKQFFYKKKYDSLFLHCILYYI